VALGLRACALGVPTAFVTAAGLIASLTRAHNENRLEEKLKLLIRPKFLIIDEIGYLPLERLGAHLFFQLVSRRYERGSILITSNQSLSGWGQVFGDSVIATAILDRLLHHSTILNIKGESYRLKEKRKAGLLTRSEPYTAPESPAPPPRPPGLLTSHTWPMDPDRAVENARSGVSHSSLDGAKSGAAHRSHRPGGEGLVERKKRTKPTTEEGGIFR